MATTRDPSTTHAATRTVRDVVPGVHLVTHGHTNCYVVEDEDGVTLVDAAYPRTWGLVRRLLGTVGRSASEIRGLVITHGHFDHTFSVLPVCQARDVPALIAPPAPTAPTACGRRSDAVAADAPSRCPSTARTPGRRPGVDVRSRVTPGLHDR